MKRRDLVNKIKKAAKDRGSTWEFDREGANHEIYTLDSITVPIPRHNEINEMTAEGIMKECEEILGRGWWR